MLAAGDHFAPAARSSSSRSAVERSGVPVCPPRDREPMPQASPTVDGKAPRRALWTCC